MFNTFLVRLNQLFDSTHSLDGLSHWIIQRFSALNILLFGVLLFLYDSIYLFLFLTLFIVFHISVGIRTLIDDYIHDDVLFLTSITFLRIILLFLLKTVFIIFIC
jgi:succinate dehydrogenase hydrophobic anchor subunit